MTTPSGLKIIDTKIGTGASPKTRPDLRHALHRLALRARRQAAEIRLVRSIAASRSSFRSASTGSSPAGTKASPP